MTKTNLTRPLLNQQKSKKKKKKRSKKTANFIIDTVGESSKRRKVPRNTGGADSSEILGADSLEEKELVTDLFGRDINDTIKSFDPIHPTAEEKDDEDAIDPSTEAKKPAWVDEDDEQIRLCEVASTMRKSRKINHTRDTSDTNYHSFLKDNFSRVHGSTPEWARLDRQLEEEEEDAYQTQFERHAGLNLAAKDSGGGLPRRILSYKCLNDLNGESRAEGAIIKGIHFHPDHQVALVAGSRQETLGCASLFKVDGRSNPKIQSVKFPKFPIKCARFLPDGKRFIVGSNLFGHVFIYDMEAGKQSHIPWNKSRERQSMKRFEVSPNGKMVVFVGPGGKLHLFDSETMSHIHSLQAPCEVRAITFNQEGSQMFTHGDNGKVFVFDMERRACVHSFYDDGCIEGTAIAVSPNNRLLACGSTSGIVNIYETSSLVNVAPQPVKIIDNLVTRITSLTFNESSEVLALSSDLKPCAMKMVHIPTFSVFENFPNQKNYVQRIQNVTFSPKSGYLAVGNNRGSALLYRLHHYTSY